jgi:ClpP class serine protease
MSFHRDLRQSSPVVSIFAKKRDQRKTNEFALRDEIPEKETEYGGEKDPQERRSNGVSSESFGGYEIPSLGGPKYIIKQDIDHRIAYVQERAPLVEIPVIGEFNEDMADNFETLMQVAISNNHNMVVVRIHSPGGSVYALNRMLSTMEIAKQ